MNRKCKWCGGVTKEGRGPSTKPDWIRCRCTGCGTIGYINDPTQKELTQVYDAAWKDAESSGTYAAGSTTKQIAYSLLDAVRWSPEGSKCLDYGGGKGFFANALLDKGCKYLAVYEPHGQNPGLSSVIWVHNISELEGKLFNWIFMIEVIEHLLNPVGELKIVQRHLAPDGKLIITTPNSNGWHAKIDCFKWREAENPTHINLFSAWSLEACLIKAGFSKAERIYRPVKYKAKGLKAVALSITQRIGVDGGLRYIATNSK